MSQNSLKRSVFTHTHTQRLLEDNITRVAEGGFCQGRRNLVRRDKKNAFTLAEILITLGIIGVVVAITIPALRTNVQDIAFAKAKENTLMKIKEATNQMKSNGVLAEYSSNAAFTKQFAEYMTVVKECDSAHLDDCFVDTFKTSDGAIIDTSTLTTGKALSGKNLADGTIAMMLKNGTTMLFSLKDATNPKNTVDCAYIDPFNNTSNTTGCMSFLYDINGRGAPNVLGRDIGSVAVTTLVCGGYKTADGTCFSGAFTPTAMSLADCNAQKSTLGITACNYDGDFWAGAVAQCGGISNMPNEDQLATLAKAFYGPAGCSTASGSSTVGVSDCSGTLDYTKASMVGLPSSGNFYVWSSVENGSDYAYNRAFTSTGSRRYSNYRHYSNRMAICLSE